MVSRSLEKNSNFVWPRLYMYLLFRNVIGCQMVFNQKYDNKDDLRFVSDNMSLTSCASKCLENIEECSYGWAYRFMFKEV